MPKPNTSKFLTGLNKFKHFPQEHLWMLVVDGRQYAIENGPEGQENREHGSVAGVLNAITKALFSYKRKLSVKLIKELHFACTYPITNKNNQMHPGIFRTNSSKVMIARGNYSSEGIASIYNGETNYQGHNDGDLSSFIFGWALKEGLSDFIHPQHPRALAALFIPDAPTIYASFPDEVIIKHIENLETARRENLPLLFSPPNPGVETDREFFKEELTILQNTFIQLYYHNIKEAKTTDQIIDVIASFGQDSVRNHPFGDLNNIIYINCLVNVLLIMNGMLPCIYEQSNIYIGNSIPQIREIIKKGQALTQQVIDNPDMEVFGFDKPLSPELKDKFSKSSLALMNVVNILIFTITPKTKNTNVGHLVSSGMFSESKSSASGTRKKETKPDVRQTALIHYSPN